MFSLKLSFNISLNDKKNKPLMPSFTDFIDNSTMKLSELSLNRRPATIKNYRTAIRSLRIYIQEADLASLPITKEELIKYERWLAHRGTSLNTSSAYIRSLRSLYYICYPDAEEDLFHHLYTGNARTSKRALDIDSVRRLMECRPLPDSPLRMWHDVFLFSIYALGMPFVDLAHLRWKDIHDGFIFYKRSKTKQQISVPITSEMQQILDLYRFLATGELVFPILGSYDTPYNKYQNRLTQYNRALKQIMKNAGLSHKLTSYVARHTWATLANKAGIRLAHISQAMGHSSIKTTQIYLAQISNDEIVADSLAVTRLMTSSKTL